MSKAKDLLESLGVFEESDLPRSKREVLSQATNNPHGLISFPTRVHNGIRHGGRHAQAASNLHKEGHLRHIKTERDTQTTEKSSKTKEYLISTYQLTDQGRDHANKNQKEE